LQAARKKLRQALRQYHSGDYAGACSGCESALRLCPDYAQAAYVLGLLACHGNAPEAGARWFRHALSQAPNERTYAAALADSMLLQQHEREAMSLYEQAFPEFAGALSQTDDAGATWKRAHPDWLQQSKDVTLPPIPRSDTEALVVDSGTCGTATHLLNWAGLLVRHRQVRAAIWLIEHALTVNADLAYGHALLALLYTLNRDWKPAVAAAAAARKTATEAFPGATDLCLLAAQFGLSYPFSDLDMVFDWSAFTGKNEEITSTERLPECRGNTCPTVAQESLIYLVCCDTDYFFTHVIGLACSIREHEDSAGIHLHIFNPRVEIWSALRALEVAVAPLRLTISWEHLDFEEYGGKALYCASARFARLAAMVRQIDNYVVTIDADSLVRGNLSATLPRNVEIGVVRAPDEPMWHQYLAGFTVFRRSAESVAFLSDFSAFLVANLLRRKGRLYLDQIGLYATAHANFKDHVTELPVQRFCDTLCGADALVWSVTQRKDNLRYTEYKTELLVRYGFIHVHP
jgi:tetratricopeptide (TPR) repeat protein